MEMKDNYPFYAWMPRPVGCLVLFLMFFPVTFSGGAYMNNLAEMAGGLGVHNEDIQLASYATSIGMALFAPFMAGFMTIRRVKHLFMRAMLILLALNAVIATTDNVVVTIAACLVIGFFRVMLMMNITFTLVKYGMGIDALSQFVLTEEPSQEERAKSEHARSWQMAGYYGVMLMIAQLGNVLTAYYAYHATCISAAMAFARVHFRWILAVGFGLLLVADIYLYFQYQTEGSFEHMALVTVINYAGLFIPYAMLVPLGMKHLPVRYMTTFVFVMLFFRNALAPVAGMSLYTNWLQERQQHYIQRLAQNVDDENQQAATYDYGLRRMGQAKGGSTLEAQQLSATAMRGKITVQATLVAMRDITGTTIWLLVGTLAFVLFFPYHRDEFA